MDRRETWKKKPSENGTNEARLLRAQRQRTLRHNRRGEEVNLRRQIETPERPVQQIPESVETRLAKFRAKKEEQKILAAKNRKKPFVVGRPHHRYYSPPPPVPSTSRAHNQARENEVQRRQVPMPAQPAPANSPAMSDRDEMPTGSEAMPLFGELIIPDTVENQENQENHVNQDNQENQVDEVQSTGQSTLAPANYKFKGPAGITPMPLFGELFIPEIDLQNFDFNLTEKEKNMTQLQTKNEMTPKKKDKSPEGEGFDSSIESVALRMSSQFGVEGDEMNQEAESGAQYHSPTPAEFSPFIVTSRGKSSARKEQKKRLSLYKTGSPRDDIPTKETIENLNISPEEECRTAQYYKFLVQSEEDRLNQLCATWKLTQDDPDTPESGRDMINQAIGQTQLLIRKKIQKFKDLVRDCESGNGEDLVRGIDLQGFWDMVTREITDCNSRFRKLEDLKIKEWIEEEAEEKAPVVGKNKKKPAPKKNTKIIGKSNIKSFIAAARKNKLTTENSGEENVKENTVPAPSPRKSLSKIPVSPHSRARLTTPRTEKTSLLKLVQLSESARKIAQTSLAMVAVSQKCKTPEVQHDTSISYVNSDQTPGKGILKKSEGQSAKATQKVNFNDTLDIKEVPTESEPDSIIKKLDFEEDDLVVTSPKLVETTVNADGNNNSSCNAANSRRELQPPPSITLPSIGKIIPPTPENRVVEVIDLVTPKVKRQVKVTKAGNSDTHHPAEPAPSSPVLRELRSRSILVEQNSTITKRRQSSQKRASKKKEESCHQDKENPIPLRKSSRNSTKLLPDEFCGVCSPRPTSPGPSNVRMSFFGEEASSSEPLPNGDLISFDSPKAPRANLRRSTRK